MTPTDSSRLKWLCRRGMKELDVLFEDYLAHRYSQADAQEQRGFALLLDMQDPQICDLLFGRARSDNADVACIIDFFRHHSVIPNETAAP